MDIKILTRTTKRILQSMAHQVPITLQVNQESRAEAKKHCRLSFKPVTNGKPIWFDFTRDTLQIDTIISMPVGCLRGLGKSLLGPGDFLLALQSEQEFIVKNLEHIIIRCDTHSGLDLLLLDLQMWRSFHLGMEPAITLRPTYDAKVMELRLEIADDKDCGYQTNIFVRWRVIRNKHIVEIAVRFRRGNDRYNELPSCLRWMRNDELDRTVHKAVREVLAYAKTLLKDDSREEKRKLWGLDGKNDEDLWAPRDAM